MHLDQPRVPPLDAAQWSDEQRELLERFERDGKLLNIFRTLAHHPKLLKRWSVFANHLLAKSSLPARDREILILRTAWLCRGEYEWGQHLRIAKQAGLEDGDIERVAAGPRAPGLSTKEAALLKAADELLTHCFVQDSTWHQLAEHYDTQQLMDLIFTVGQYTSLAMALNTLGVQLEPGVQGFSVEDSPTMELKPPEGL